MIYVYNTVEQAQDAVYNAGYQRPYDIFMHMNHGEQVGVGYTIEFVFNEKDKTRTKLLYDPQNNQVYAYTEDLLKRHIIPMTERSYSGQHVTIWSWQDYQLIISPDWQDQYAKK